MRQARAVITVRSERRGLREISDAVDAWVGRQGIRDGLLTVFIRHTSASLLIQENADPDVQRDLEDFLDALAPEDASLYRHRSEGPDDMPAHIKGALTQAHLAVPVADGRMMLGRWQGIFLFEHRHVPRDREVVLHLSGV